MNKENEEAARRAMGPDEELFEPVTHTPWWMWLPFVIVLVFGGIWFIGEVFYIW